MRLLPFVALVTLVGCAGQSAVDSGPRGKGPENTVAAEAQQPGRCDDAPLRTLEDIATGGTATDGRVALDLVPAVEGTCTLLDCGDSECCNRCGGAYGAKLVREPTDRDLEVHLEGLTGCAGMDCNFHCEPFGRAPTARYRFVGTLRFQPAGTTSTYHQAFVTVEKFCAL